MIGLQFQLPHKLDKRSLRENIALKENSDYKLKGSDSKAEQFKKADKNLHLLGSNPQLWWLLQGPPTENQSEVLQPSRS